MNLPPRARAFFWLVVLAALPLAALSLRALVAAPAPVPSPLRSLVLVQLAVLMVAARHFPINAGGHRRVDIGLALLFALVVYEGAPLAPLLAGACQLVGQLTLLPVGAKRLAIGRRGLPGVLFNTAQTVIGTSAACAVIGMASPSAIGWLAIPAAAAVLHLANSGIVATMSALHQGSSPWRVWLNDRAWSSAQAAGMLVLGYLSAEAAAGTPLVPVLMVVPAALTHAAVRRSAEAEAGLRLRDEFLRVAAHELRTPLTSLRGYAQLLARQIQRDPRLAGDPRLQRAAETIDGQSDRLCALIEQLLDVSRLQTGKLELDREPVELASMVRRLASELQSLTPQYVLVVRAEEPTFAEVDQVRLEQVLTNLVNNAARHAAGGDRIEIGITRGKGAVQLTVRDFGIGIPKEARERIFERYAQVADKPASGLGLGLYITQQIVRAHGGAIQVDCPTLREGGGTLFTIRLPEGNVSHAVIGDAIPADEDVSPSSPSADPEDVQSQERVPAVAG